MSGDPDLNAYYLNQVGGASGIYSGNLFQRGRGVGGFLSGLFRSVLPLLRRRGIALGKSLFSTGVDVLGDMQNDISLKSSYENRKVAALNKLKDSLITGNGYKNTRKRKLIHSSPSFRMNNIRAAKKQKKQKSKKKKNISKGLKDIFCV
jgi:hypothetical protein